MAKKDIVPTDSLELGVQEEIVEQAEPEKVEPEKVTKKPVEPTPKPLKFRAKKVVGYKVTKVNDKVVKSEPIYS